MFVSLAPLSFLYRRPKLYLVQIRRNSLPDSVWLCLGETLFNLPLVVFVDPIQLLGEVRISRGFELCRLLQLKFYFSLNLLLKRETGLLLNAFCRNSSQRDPYLTCFMRKI